MGVRGVAIKEEATDVLVKAIRAVDAGAYWIGREVFGDLIDGVVRSAASAPHGPRKGPFGLTARELELVALVAARMSNKDISRKCALREDTVKHHMSSIFDKTAVSSRLELALFAQQNGLVETN